MKKLAVLLFILIFFLVVLLISSLNKGVTNLISPVSKQEKILGINQWFPGTVSVVQSVAPKVSAEAALFLDTHSGQIFYSKNPNKKLPVASLVKVMTVLIALERKKMDDFFLVSKRAAEMEQDKMLLIAGEKLTLKELLYGIFLISANDAAEVLSEETTGDRGEFIQLMNMKAKQLGMENSYFVNPTGLDEDSNNSYSSAYDLAILSRYLIKHYPEVVEISRTPHIILPQAENHQDYDMYSGINLLTTYPGVVGFKTGFTPKAGMTLITLARRGDREVLGVLLGSESRRDEAKSLLDLIFGVI